LKVKVTAIHNINRTGFRDQFVEDVYFMNFALGDSDKRRDVSLQI